MKCPKCGNLHQVFHNFQESAFDVVLLFIHQKGPSGPLQTAQARFHFLAVSLPEDMNSLQIYIFSHVAGLFLHHCMMLSCTARK